MRPYQARKIEFREVVIFEEWKVKVYTITHHALFQSDEVLKNAMAKLGHWLKKAEQQELPTDHMAYLIVHEGSDGVWTLLNCWCGGEMLQTITFFTSFEKRNEFSIFSENGSLACVWELAVIAHERKAWIEHILRHAHAPKFNDYVMDVINETR